MLAAADWVRSSSLGHATRHAQAIFLWVPGDRCHFANSVLWHVDADNVCLVRNGLSEQKLTDKTDRTDATDRTPVSGTGVPFESQARGRRLPVPR